MSDYCLESIFPAGKYISNNKHLIEKRFIDDYLSNTDKDVLNLKDQLNVNDNYSISKTEFKPLLTKLMGLASMESDSRAQASALLLLQIILFNDCKRGKSELTKIAVKASLIPNLILINESTKESEIKELVLSFYLLLCFVVSDNNTNVKELLLLRDNLLIGSTIRSLEGLKNEKLINDSLILFQFYIYYSKEYKTIEPIFGSLKKLVKHSEPYIISQTCYTLLVFSEAFREARVAIIESKIGQNLLNLWIDSENDEQIIKPIFGIIASLLSRFNNYKNQFLSTELNILEIIPKLISSSTELNKIYANEIIKIIAMKPISAKHYSSSKQINTIIKFKIIEKIIDLLKTDSTSAVKSSVLNTIFVVANNSSLDQLKLMVEQGCLQALCSQLESDNENDIKITLLSLTIFLMQEFKDFLKKELRFVDPREPTPFAKIIGEGNGVNKLIQINLKRIQKESLSNKGLSESKLKELGYKLNDVEKMVEDILVHSFGVDTRPERRLPRMKVLEERQSLIACCDCKNALANTDIFSCHHITYCKKCGASAVAGGSKKCSVEKCEKSIPESDVPYFIFKSKQQKEYLSQEKKLEMLFEPEFYK